MGITGVLFKQIAIMFLLMFVGAWLYKTKRVSPEGTKSLGNILIYAIMPSVVINAFLTEYSPEKLRGFGIAFLFSLLGLLLAMGVSALLFKKHPIENFGTSFSNAGFLGVPIVSVIFGTEAVFYASSFVALLNILQWTYGVFVITGDKRQISFKKIATNPVVLSLAAGFIIFLLPFEMPEIISGTIGYMSGMNAPVAMFSLGTYLAQVSLSDLLRDKTAYLSAAVRLVVVPVLTALLLCLVPDGYEMLSTALIIVAATPVGSNVAIFAQIHNKNYKQAVKSVCLSTVLSIVTMPLVVSFAQWLWQAL